MDTCTDCNYAVARHPIYRLDGGVFGYELLYRTIGGPNAASIPSDEEATLAVLANGITTISQDIGPDHKIFINFSKHLLEKGYHRFLDPQRFVIEILETVACDERFAGLVRSIHEAGFVLALDDYVGNPAFDPILPFMTYIKLDFLELAATPERLPVLIERLQRAGKTLLAEKVETEADIALCRAHAIPLAQGYYYARPQVVQTKALDANKAVKLHLLAEISQPDMDVRRIRDIIGSDVSLTYKLLRYVNTASFNRGKTVESIDYAIALLGRNNLASWAAVHMLASLGSTPRDRELAFASAVRGRFLALVDAMRGHTCHDGQVICLLGLLSLLDAMLGMPMERALSGITIEDRLRRALLGQASPSAPCLTLCRGFDGQASQPAATVLRSYAITPEQAAALYYQALAWASAMFRE